MTAVAEDTEAPALAPEPEPPSEPETVAHRRSRAQLELEIRETLERYAARRILARQMCTGEEDVRNGRMCNDGTQDFMAKCMLHPPGNRVVDLNHSREPEMHRLAGERLLRQDVWKPFGEPDCDLGDFTVQGLTRRLKLALEADEKWAGNIRQRIVEQTGGYISAAKRDEAFAKLGLEPWIPHRRIEYSVRGILNQATVTGTSRASQAQSLRERIVRALRAEFGDELGSEADMLSFTAASARDI